MAKANEQAWNLIEDYGLIKDEDWHIDEETGKIVIDKSGKDKAT
nr:MAG TPA: Histone H3-like centromeric protein CSE4 single chain of Cse4+Scm3+H4 [Caudoviricetes sp.]